MSIFFMLINALSSILIVAHCICRLTTESWSVRHPELWIHGALTAFSLCVFLSNLDGRTQSPYEIGLNTAVAAYFMAQTWRFRGKRFIQHW